VTLPTCPVCHSQAIAVQMPDSPDVFPLKCRKCGHEWEVQAERVSSGALSRLAPLPHWR
jgi:transcription elongation factor Elf1